jgi:hypothetical protein
MRPLRPERSDGRRRAGGSSVVLQPALETGDHALVHLDLLSQRADSRTQRHHTSRTPRLRAAGRSLLLVLRRGELQRLNLPRQRFVSPRDVEQLRWRVVSFISDASFAATLDFALLRSASLGTACGLKRGKVRVGNQGGPEILTGKSRSEYSSPCWPRLFPAALPPTPNPSRCFAFWH